jgi:murein DD-endopeptidase MepM/ murein hydrolase activator NlpD
MDVLRWFITGVVLLAFYLSFPSPEVMGGAQPSEPNIKISLSARKIPQGGLGLITIEATEGGMPQVSWMEKKLYLVLNEENRTWQGFIAVDLRQKPGPYALVVKDLLSGRETRAEIQVEKKDYGVRRLTVPKEMVDLDAPTLERVKKEAKTMSALWHGPASEAVWKGSFVRPLEGEVVGPFGRRSIINDQPRSPHSGVDFRAQKGTPVRAINYGRAVLTADHFFPGQSVVIDHGGGILSMYFHLDKILVQENQFVEKGQVVGLVGASGRATGPHLHLGIRINGARVDPLDFMTLSEDLE